MPMPVQVGGGDSADGVVALTHDMMSFANVPYEENKFKKKH